MALSNLPPGVDHSDPHFHGPDQPDRCPSCYALVGDEPICLLCGYALDPAEAEAIERDEAYERRREW